MHAPGNLKKIDTLTHLHVFSHDELGAHQLCNRRLQAGCSGEDAMNVEVDCKLQHRPALQQRTAVCTVG